jgi:predicted dienelactone hydrolase
VSPRRRALLLGLLAGPAVQAVPTPAADSVEDFIWTDAARSRELPLRMRWPAGDGPCGLVLYSHGLGGSREGADVWGSTWAEAGLAVLHLQHPGSDGALLRAGRAGLRAGGTPQQLLQRVADVRFVLDELARRALEPPWSRVRQDAIGLGGHSFGALTVQALAGQRYALPGDLSDARLRAFVALSPSPGRGGLSVEQQFGRITRPFLAVTGSLDGDPLGMHPGRSGEWRATVYDGLPRGQRALLWLDGADHMSFAGQGRVPIRSGGALGARDAAVMQREPAQQRTVARVTAVWWLRWLVDDRYAQMALYGRMGLGPGERWRFD